MLSLKGGSIFQSLRKGRSSTAQLHTTEEKLGSNRGAIGEWSGSKRLGDCWWFMRNNIMRSIYSLKLCTYVMKLCRLTYKIHSTETRWTKTSLNSYPYRLTRSSYQMTHFINIDGLLMKLKLPAPQGNTFFSVAG